MSENESEASAEASGEPPAVSVLDILYCDGRRIGAFLSQFDDLGVPTRVSVSESVQKARGRAFRFGVSGGVTGIGNASLNVERGPAAIGGQESETRDYDPLWANAFALLDYLESNSLISREPTGARIGQFVLATGSLAVMDLTLFRGIWSMPALRDAVKQGQEAATGLPSSVPQSSQQRKAERRLGSAAQAAKTQGEIAIDGALSLVGMLPHAIQVRVALPESGPVIWASLRDDAMVVSAADLVLKHGMAVAGEWSMMGILDALPDTDQTGALTQDGIDAALRSLALGDSAFGQMMFQMLPHLRPLLGRPFFAYGMTPLLIYRKISG